MNSRALRRLAADHSSLREQTLPPNYLFSPDADDNDNLTELDILLAGPSHTPFAKGVFKLHLAIPNTYPQQPPTAYFRTPIFHPNVDPQTGGVCVETLKRDWDANLTLKDVLVVISCLLIQPNPDSALNAEAGALIQEDYSSFGRRAELMTSIHASIPKAWSASVIEAQTRGGDVNDGVSENGRQNLPRPAAARRRVPAPRQRRTAVAKRSDVSPSAAISRRRQQTTSTRPFTLNTRDDDVFGTILDQTPAETIQMDVDMENEIDDDNESTQDDDRENSLTNSPTQAFMATNRVFAVRRPQGNPVPLGELTLDESADYGLGNSPDSSDMEPEYPPSPRKSPKKSSPAKPSTTLQSHLRPENSRFPASHDRNITPINAFDRPLALDSPFTESFVESPSPRKKHVRRGLIFHGDTQSGDSPSLGPFPGNGKALVTPGFDVTSTPSSMQTPELATKLEPYGSPSHDSLRFDDRHNTNMRLWELCGENARRWNLGDFDGDPFPRKAARW